MTPPTIAAIVIISFAVALALTALIRRLVRACGPFEYRTGEHWCPRSVPRGGGLSAAIVGVCLAATLCLFDLASVESAVIWCAAGASVAAVGLIDDLRGLPIRTRLVVHFAAAAILMLAVKPPGMPAWFDALPLASLWLSLLTIIAAAWSINLFNFMDGIDGLAATQAVFVLAGGSFLALLYGGMSGQTILALSLAAASLGLLCWNWYPARIFMGDVGSGFLGFALPACALSISAEGVTSVWTWITLHGIFVSDATVTLGTRLLRGEKPHLPHCTHAYQHLARRWQSHPRVVAVYMSVNLCWLFPLAGYTVVDESAAPMIAAVALAPISIAAMVLGAGRPPKSSAATPEKVITIARAQHSDR